MAVSDLTIRVSGTVAYSDNSHGSFEATAVWKTNLGGVIAQHSSVDSQLHFAQLYADKAAEVNATLAILPAGSEGVVGVTPPSPSPNKLVTSFVMEVSGLVTLDDNSNSSFVAQWVNGVLDLYPDETVPAWRSIAGFSTEGTNPYLVQVFEALAGAGNATISV